MIIWTSCIRCQGRSYRLPARHDRTQTPAANGYVGILPGHAALLAELGAGELSYAAGGRRHSLTVSGGWLEVASDHVRVLADGAE